MDRAFQRIHSLMLRGTFYSVPPIRWMKTEMEMRRNICKHLNKYTLYTLGGGCNFVLAITASPNYNEQIRI